MTAPHPTPVERETPAGLEAMREDVARSYVLVKRGLYWRPNALGYTGVLDEAGRYSEAEARAHVDHASRVTALLASEAPRFSEACWQETIVKTLELDLAKAASAFARLTEHAETAEADQRAAEASNDALCEKLRSLAPHGSCACSYDQPGDVCAHHSPALTAAEATIATLHAEIAAMGEENARLRGALYRFVNLQGSLIPRRVFAAARAALANTETNDA